MIYRRDGARPEVRRAIGRFLLLNVLAMIVVAAGAIGWSIHVSRTQAVREAGATARSIANGMVAPLCTPELRHGDPAAIDALDRIVRNRMRDGSVLRVKVWTPGGRIVYSDAPSLIGRVFEIDDEDKALFGTDRAVAQISALARPENQLEIKDSRRMVETYVGIRDTDGEPLLFEAYFPGSHLDANAAEIARELTPVALATIIALQLLQLPLALVLARRLDQAHGEHRRLLEHAVAASDLERRRIARDLHDGVIQDLAGVGYMLDSIKPQVTGAADRVVTAVDRAAEIVQRGVRALRQTMTDLYPPNLAGGGLEPAINELAGPLREAGVHCNVRVADTSGLPEVTVLVLYRAVRELLRNVAKHAAATEVDIDVEIEDGRAVLTVADNGIGFDPASPPSPANHLGRHLMEEAVRDAGGELVTTSSPGAGTTVRITTRRP